MDEYMKMFATNKMQYKLQSFTTIYKYNRSEIKSNWSFNKIELTLLDTDQKETFFNITCPIEYGLCLV